GIDTRLKSAWVKIPHANQNPRLRFWQWFLFSADDYGQVQIQTKTSSWVSIGNNCAGTGSQVWTVQEIDLSQWADSTIQIGFYFHSDDYFFISGPDVGP